MKQRILENQKNKTDSCCKKDMLSKAALEAIDGPIVKPEILQLP